MGAAGKSRHHHSVFTAKHSFPISISAVLQNPPQHSSSGSYHWPVGIGPGEGEGEGDLSCRVLILVVPQWPLCLWRSPYTLETLIVPAGRNRKVTPPKYLFSLRMAAGTEAQKSLLPSSVWCGTWEMWEIIYTKLKGKGWGKRMCVQHYEQPGR